MGGIFSFQGKPRMTALGRNIVHDSVRQASACSRWSMDSLVWDIHVSGASAPTGRSGASVAGHPEKRLRPVCRPNVSVRDEKVSGRRTPPHEAGVCRYSGYMDTPQRPKAAAHSHDHARPRPIGHPLISGTGRQARVVASSAFRVHAGTAW